MKLTTVVLSIFLLGANVCAQSTTSTLVGTVTDASGALMSGVSVIATDNDTNYSRSGTTNENGIYSISSLNPGNYRVDFEQERFKTAQATWSM